MDTSLHIPSILENAPGIETNLNLAGNLVPQCRENGASTDQTSTSDPPQTSGINDFSNTILKYINEILMEDDLDYRPCMLQDCLALQAAEKSFYDIIGEKYPHQGHFYAAHDVDTSAFNFAQNSSTTPHQGQDVDTSAFNFAPNSSTTPNQGYFCATPDAVTSGFNFTLNSIIAPHQCHIYAAQDAGTSRFDFAQNSSSTTPHQGYFYAAQEAETSGFNFTQNSSTTPQRDFHVAQDAETSSYNLAQNSSSTKNMFDPKWSSNQRNLHSSEVRSSPGDTSLYPSLSQLGYLKQPWGSRQNLARFLPGAYIHESNMDVQNNRMYVSGDSSRTKNIRQRDDRESCEDRNCNKHSSVYVDDSDQFEFYDKVLICKGEFDELRLKDLDEAGENRQGNKSRGRYGQTSRGTKQGHKSELVDLCSILTRCSTTVARNDRGAAMDLLKQIREHSSPSGDGTQRLAHYFADALEARLGGFGTVSYLRNTVSTTDILKAYMFYVESCPFTFMSNSYANRMIAKQTGNSTRLHIIDFGIGYGFQWPCLIERIPHRPGGPPRIRITAIEFPQPGFRPMERIEDTGRNLEKYCKRFNVPFEYSVIAKKWETITTEDLRIDRHETTVVNCMYRMKNILDETSLTECPRDDVLKLIKRINPDLFVHGIINGTYNATYYTTRFKEALFHFSALFDMLDATTPRESHQRMLFEKEIYGREALNTIACEGLQGIERPESYKQWQCRDQNVGFTQLPLDQELFKKVRAQVRLNHHKDFMFDQDGHWILQGWKGRVTHALSCWKPA